MLRHHLSHGPILGPPTDHFHGVQHLQSFPRAPAIGPIGWGKTVFHQKPREWFVRALRQSNVDSWKINLSNRSCSLETSMRNGFFSHVWLPEGIHEGQDFVSIRPIAIHQNHGSHLAIFGKTNWLVYLQLLGIIGRRTNHGNPEKTHPKMLKFKVWVWHNKNCYPLAV